MGPLRVLLLGHSFMSRLHAYMCEVPLKANLGLSSLTHEVRVLGVSGGRIDSLESHSIVLSKFQPHVICRDLGISDLDSRTPSRPYTCSRPGEAHCGFG